MKFSTYLLLLLVALLFLFAVNGCDCGNDDDDDDDDDDDSNNDDDDGDDDDDNAADANCAAEKSCYEDVADCIGQSDTYADLMTCVSEAGICLSSADSCTSGYMLCISNCVEAEDPEACMGDCVDHYYSCFTSCGWDYDCFDHCSTTMDECTADCPLSDFQCWQTCFVEGYDTCMQSCF